MATSDLLGRLGASDTCVATQSGGERGGGKRLDLLFCWSLRPTTAEVKGSCSGPAGLLRIIDPCDRPLDPRLPSGSWHFSSSPGLNGCSPSFHRPPEVKTGQGRTNEVRAAVQGDLCPCAAQTASLETSFEATVRILPVNATGNDAKKGLNCKNVKKIKLSGAVYAFCICIFLWH